MVYGQEPGYSDYLNGMLAELAGNYGQLAEIFIDGAGPAAGGRNCGKPRTFNVPLDFLGQGDYRAKLFMYGKDAAKQPKSVEVKEMTVNSKDTLMAELSLNGGYAAYLTPVNK